MDLAEHAKCTKRLAGKATYALKEMGLIEKVGVKNRYHLFERMNPKRLKWEFSLCKNSKL